ncbi:MAG: arginine--tRNA ligase [Myxococcota bacterium]
MRLERTLAALAADALREALDLPETPPALLRKTQDAKFGDFQVNGVMALAKRQKANPRELAGPVAERLASLPAIAKAEVAGPGFVNLTLDPAWVGERLSDDATDGRLGVGPVETPETIVVDFSSPNIAKQMHVGHLRSTILGQALVQLLRRIGHRVIGDNHLGDWGTQFGLLIVGLRAFGDEVALEADAIGELERVYKAASARAKEDEAFAAEARAELAKLQQGDASNRATWERMVATTRETLDTIYARLGTTFDEWLGESAYDAMLPAVVAQLEARGIAREDEGALCVFLHELDPAAIEGALPDAIPKKLKKNKTPFIVRKKDGAFLYSTTDIATILHRRDVFEADRSVYVVGAPQGLHFQQLFATARLLGVDMTLAHVAFGQVLDAETGKILRTRGGTTVTLRSLLDEAELRAREKIEEQRQQGRLRIADEDMDEAVRTIGIGAVKYVDLQQNRLTDYRFDSDKMVSFSGNAGPYLQYQYARIRSIFRKGEVDWEAAPGAIAPEEPSELALAKTLLRFADVVHEAAESYQPHLLCAHLYDVAQAFSRFYTECPVLDARGATRASRLALTQLSGRQLEEGLGLLGIGVLDRM